MLFFTIVSVASIDLCFFVFLFFYLQESVEMKQVENISDTEGYPNLEGHCRAASLPRLNAEYYVSPSLLIVPFVLVLRRNISLAHSLLFCGQDRWTWQHDVLINGIRKNQRKAFGIHEVSMCVLDLHEN